MVEKKCIEKKEVSRCMNIENKKLQIKERIRKLPREKIEKVKEVLKEIKRLKGEGKDEMDNEMLKTFLKFKQLIK